MAMASSSLIHWPREGRTLSRGEKKYLHQHARKYGIEISLPRHCDADPKVLLTYVDAAQEVVATFPELGGDARHPLTIRVRQLSADMFAFSPAQARHILDVNEASVRDLQALSAEYKKLADDGWFVPETDFRAVVFHELGHRYAAINKISSLRIARSIIGTKDTDTIYSELKSKLSRYSVQYKNGQEIISEVFSAWFSKTNNKFAMEFMDRLLDLR